MPSTRTGAERQARYRQKAKDELMALRMQVAKGCHVTPMADHGPEVEKLKETLRVLRDTCKDLKKENAALKAEIEQLRSMERHVTPMENHGPESDVGDETKGYWDSGNRWVPFNRE